MSIIEKLGIKETPEYYGDTFGRSDFVCVTGDVRVVEKQRDKILEALIEVTFEECFHKPGPPVSFEPTQKKISIIEKATGKSWEEIKEQL